MLDGRRDTSRVLVANLDRVERSTSRASGVGRGVLIGALIGAAAGGGVGYALSSPGGSEPAPYLVPAGIGAGALIGGVFGGIRGSSSSGERWETMPTVSVDRAQSGAAAGSDVRVGFATRLSFSCHAATDEAVEQLGERYCQRRDQGGPWWRNRRGTDNVGKEFR